MPIVDDEIDLPERQRIGAGASSVISARMVAVHVYHGVLDVGLGVECWMLVLGSTVRTNLGVTTEV